MEFSHSTSSVKIEFFWLFLPASQERTPGSVELLILNPSDKKRASQIFRPCSQDEEIGVKTIPSLPSLLVIRSKGHFYLFHSTRRQEYSSSSSQFLVIWC